MDYQVFYMWSYFTPWTVKCSACDLTLTHGLPTVLHVILFRDIHYPTTYCTFDKNSTDQVESHVIVPISIFTKINAFNIKP